jgi:SAM-dependent methyltransferase
MTTANEFWQGYAPEVKVQPGNPEAQKYGKMWERPEYRVMAPGEIFAGLFLTIAKPAKGARVIDFGCGTGRGAAKLAQAGLQVTMIDFVRNCLDPAVKDIVDGPDPKLYFIKGDLEKPIAVTAEYGFCTDVMEHIPPDKVGVVLDNILKAAQHVWVSIAMFEDACGELIGEKLHLSVHKFDWWRAQFEARDCVIKYGQSTGDGKYAHFYVSAWQDGKAIVEHGVINTEQEQIRTNVRHNCEQGWTPCQPHEGNDFECMILGGGPSMAAFEDEIKKNRADGVKLLTLNGAYNWAVHHGITPSAQIVVDARAFNARFVDPVVDGCKYLISSQCDPSVFDKLPQNWRIRRPDGEFQRWGHGREDAGHILEYDSEEDARQTCNYLANDYAITGLVPELFISTYIWHTSAEMIADILQEFYPIQYWAIPGGSTVLLRAIPLMRMLGYRKFILYGCDSCVTNGNHHAYEQKENDSEPVFPVVVNPGGRVFQCTTWQISQGQEFIDLIRYLGEEIELDVRGDGLLSHILQVGAEQAEIQEIKLD